MKRILSLLLLLAATMFTTALYAQGHFDWVKSYNGVPDHNHRTDINTIVGSVTDSDGNLYILGEFTPGAQIDGTDLLPFAPYGIDHNIQSVVIAKLSPDGQLLWHKSIHTNYGASSVGVGIQIVGDTSIVCMARINWPGDRPDNYTYFLDTLWLGSNGTGFPTDSLVSGKFFAYLEFDKAGQLKEQHFLTAACIYSDGTVMMRDSTHYIDGGLACKACAIDNDGNIVCVVSTAVGIHTFRDSTFWGYRLLLDGGENHFDIPIQVPTSSKNCQILKFAPHFSQVLSHQDLFEPNNTNLDQMDPYVSSLMTSPIDNSVYLLFTMITCRFPIDFRIVGLPDVSILTNNSTEYSFQIKYDSLLNPQWLFQLDHAFTSSDSSTRKSYSMYAQSLDEDGDVYCLGWIWNLANSPISFYADTFSINVRNGVFFVRLDSDSGHALSVGEVRSSGRSLFNGLHAYMMVTHNNYVIAQLLYQGDIYMRDSTITNPFPNHWSTGLYVWDKEGHEVEFIDYLSSGGADGDPRSVTLHDSILYLSGQLVGGGTFGDHTLPAGYRAFIAKYVDTAFMTPYVYNDPRAEQTIDWKQDLYFSLADSMAFLTATASSGLPVTYSCADTSIARIIGDTLYLLAEGITTVTASQSGDAYSYLPATPVTKTLSVGQVGISDIAMTQPKVYPNPTKGMVTIDLGEMQSQASQQRDSNDVKVRLSADGNAFVNYKNPFRQRVNVEYSGQQPITAAYLTDIMGRTEQVELSATAPGRYTLDLTARPQAAYLLTLVTQDGHRHTVRLLKQSEVFGK